MSTITATSLHSDVTPWSFARVWNDSLLAFDERTPQPRDYVYASEIGGAFIDRYLKMQGTTPSNPPNDRSRRKFQAGNIWEWIIGFVLTRAGLRRERQLRVEGQLTGCLRVSGRLDYVGGGTPDFDMADAEIARMDLPPFLHYACRQIVDQLRAAYTGKVLEEVVLEVKSVSSFVFERLEATGQYNTNHGLQLFHYAYFGNMPGKLVYVCKDDCRLKEFRIEAADPALLRVYHEDLTEITRHYRSGEQPPREPLMVFDEGTYKFNKNFWVEYSPFLSLLYGYKNPDDYRAQFLPLAASYNRVFKRCVDCAAMTKLNLEVIAEAKKRFPRWDEWVERAKIAKAKGELLENPTEDAE